MFAWLSKLLAALKRESAIPSPRFRASKKVATILYGVWYGRLSPDEARVKARAWGFGETEIEEMIADATRPPSYWSSAGAGEPRG
jgi:hypothetical protein